MDSWGRSVYDYMGARLCHQREYQRPARNWYYMRRDVVPGLGFADGSRATQERSPFEPQWCLNQFWPVLLSRTGMENQVAAYCQDQALTGSRPWMTHADRVFMYGPNGDVIWMGQCPPAPTPGPAPQNHPSTAPTTVVIEEVDEPDTTDEPDDFELVSDSEGKVVEF